MKKTLTAAQAAKAAERKAQFRALWKQVAAMPECERAAKFEHMPYVNVQGHAFSVRNMMMLALQGGGTVFGGFRQWIAQGRAVKKGEHGKMILVPVGITKTSEAADIREGVYFIAGTVFDISQTMEIETSGACDDAIVEHAGNVFVTQSEPETCGKKAFGFMPACVLAKGHAGDCSDGFGGHYTHPETQQQEAA